MMNIIEEISDIRSCCIEILANYIKMYTNVLQLIKNCKVYIGLLGDLRFLKGKRGPTLRRF